MLTEDELAALESLLLRARAAASQVRSEPGGTVNVGDLVQLRPGADPHWQTSLLLVCKIRDDGRISGVVLRPHRSGSRDAWYTYSPPEVLRIGRAPFPPPEQTVAATSFPAQCPRCLGRDGGAPFLEPAIDPYCPKCSAAAAAEPKEIQIGPRFWWVPFPETRGRKRKPAEDQPAIEEQPNEQQDGAALVPEPKPIQQEKVALPLKYGTIRVPADEAAKFIQDHPEWVKPKPIRQETRGRKRKPVGLAEDQQAGEIAGLRIGQGQWLVVDNNDDDDSWLTKKQAADAVGVHVHTIERLAQAGHLQVARRKRPEGGSPIAVYHPGDVERIAQGRDDIQGFALTPERRSEIARKGAAARWGQDLQDGAAALPEPKPIQRETGEIAALQIGQLLWWVESA